MRGSAARGLSGDLPCAPLRLRAFGKFVIKISEPEDSTQQVFMTPEARLNDTYLIWWGPFLEGTLWLCWEFVDAEEPDQIGRAHV